MDLQTRKLTLIQEFLKIQNEEIIFRIEKLLYTKSQQDDKNLQPMSMKEFDKRIDQSLDDSKNDRVIKATDLLEEIKGWN